MADSAEPEPRDAGPPVSSPRPDAAASGDVAAAAETTASANSSEGLRPGQAAKKPKAKKVNGKNQGKNGFPSILSELGFTMSSKGLSLPESRKNFLKRRREARELGIIPQWTPMDIAVGDDRHKKKQRSKKVGVQLDELESDLFHAAFTGDTGLCREVLAAGASINIRTNADLDGLGTNATALHIAAAKGHAEVVATLLQARADAGLASGRGEMPVQLATRAGNVDVVRILSAVGASPADPEGALRLLETAPSWSVQKQRGMHTALVSKKWGAGAASYQSSNSDRWCNSEETFRTPNADHRRRNDQHHRKGDVWCKSEEDAAPPNVDHRGRNGGHHREGTYAKDEFDRSPSRQYDSHRTLHAAPPNQSGNSNRLPPPPPAPDAERGNSRSRESSQKDGHVPAARRPAKGKAAGKGVARHGTYRGSGSKSGGGLRRSPGR